MTGNSKLICRACLGLIQSSDKATSVNQYSKKLKSQKVLIKDVMWKCIPDMDLDICHDAVICEWCHDALVTTFMFKSRCHQTEEKIYSYMEQHNLGLGDKVDLLNLLEQNDDVVIISDSESVSGQFVSCSRSENDVGQFVSCSGNEHDVEMNLAFENGNFGGTTDKSDEKRCSSYAGPSLNEIYMCARCDYKSYSKENLKEHVHCNCKNRTPRIYQCDHCPHRSDRKKYLVRHRRKHGVKGPYSCGLCEKRFFEKGNMRLHILYKHSVSGGTANPFKCELQDCEQTFHRKSDFNLHIVTHYTYRPFICQLCKKGFLEKAQWDAHLEDVHGMY